MVRRFLDHYLNYTPATVDRQMADALNMMTGNFKALVLARLREDDTINKIQDDHIITNFTIRTITAVQDSPSDLHCLRGERDSPAEKQAGDDRPDRGPIQRTAGGRPAHRV